MSQTLSLDELINQLQALKDSGSTTKAEVIGMDGQLTTKIEPGVQINLD